MRRTFSGLLVLLAAACAGGSFAETFNLQGTLASGGSLSGTITLDPATTFVNTIDATVTAGGQSFLFTGPPFMDNHVGPLPSPTDAFFLYITQNTITNTDLSLEFPATTPFLGGSLCSTSFACPQLLNGSSFFNGFASTPATEYFTSLTATPLPTPEPQSITLLLTGLVAGGAALRRRSSSRGRNRRQANSVVGENWWT